MKSYSFLAASIIALFTHFSFGQTNVKQTAEKFEQTADTLFKTFKYDSASVYYRKAAELYEQDEEWLPCVKNYRLTSNALLKAAKYDTALYYTRKALDIAETQFQPSNKNEMFEKSDVLLNMADVYEKKGKYEGKLTYYKKALELILKADSSAKLRIAVIGNEIGLAYQNIAKYDSALEYFQKALKIRILVLGENHPDVSNVYENIGVVYKLKAKYDKALEYFKKSLLIRIAVFKENSSYVAISYNNLAITYEIVGDYNNAMEYNQKALAIKRLLFGENHRNTVNSYYNIGVVYRDKGEYDKALTYCQKALKIQILGLGENNQQVALIYYFIGIIYRDMGDYDKSLEFSEMSLKIRKKIFGDKNPVIAANYNCIAIDYYYKGEYENALKYYQKSLQMSISINGDQAPDVGSCYNNIGMVYENKAEYDNALEYYQKALKIQLFNFGEQHPYVANTYNNLGKIYERKNNFEKALDYYQKAIQIQILAYDNRHPYIADSYYNIGGIYSKKNKLLMALKYYHKSLMTNTIGFTDTSFYINPELKKILSKSVLIEALAGKANAFYQLYKDSTNSGYDLETSLSTYTLVFQLINSMRNGYNIEDTKLLLSEKTKSFYAQAAHVALEYNKTNPSRENNIKPFEFIEKGKSATMTVRFNEYKAQHFAGIPDSLLEMEKGLRTEIGFYTTQITNQKYQKDGYDTLKVNGLENKNFSCSRKLDSLITYFEIAYPAYYEFKHANRIVPIPEIQKSFNHNTAILNYFIGDSSLFITIITDSIYKIGEIKIDSSFEKLVTEYHKSIKTAEPKLFLKYSPLLYEKLIAPVKEVIANKERLIIVPDDYLYYVPFETLIENASSTKVSNEDYSKLNYLIKSHSINYHHSATLWYNSKKREGEQAATRKMNFVGFAPVFSKENKNGLIVSSNINAIDSTGNNLAYRSISTDMKRFNPLPYSKDEITSIVHLFEKKKKEAKAYIYNEASEANFKNNTNNFSIIHVSSHGFSNDKEPNLSGIVFSQPTDTLEKEDGILYTGETYNLNLHADLITLSSCESGLGKLIRGEGLQALSRGFLYAGAPNVIFSLWRALDKPTEDLMVQFYSYVLEGNTYAESLRMAKLKLINDPNTAFPHFWSGFVLVGR